MFLPLLYPLGLLIATSKYPKSDKWIVPGTLRTVSKDDFASVALSQPRTQKSLKLNIILIDAHSSGPGWKMG
jgi:hypothetical protein